MSPKKQGDPTLYVEQWGMLFEVLGASRVMGKILGWLLICDPPEQTARQIADAVGMSIASISTATRSLTQASMIERVRVRGERSARFRIRPGMWAELLKRRMGYASSMGELAEKGQGFLDPKDKSTALRLREIQSYCRFIEREMPALLARWEEQWKKERG